MIRFPHKKIIPLVQNRTYKQAIKNVCGEKLGHGLYRDVYILKQDPRFVVKVDNGTFNGDFTNVTEWRNYINNREWKWLEKWLAPCEMITESGKLLFQVRVDQSRPKKDFPKEIPVLFTDLKYSNFGWIGKQFVCCDYAFFPIYFIKEGGKMYKRARWWGL
jgi:hypothetical protein